MSHCPVPIHRYSHVLLAHGSGGLLSRQLIEDIIAPRLSNEALAPLEDAARLPALSGPPMLSMDGYTVSPWAFPGGDIGSLAVSGSVNDMVMSGGQPVALTAAFILEEGFAVDDLCSVLDSMAREAAQVGIAVVAGDTKVVPRGQCGGIFISTTCLGQALPQAMTYPRPPQVGDVLLVSGPLARHGVAIAAARQTQEGPPPAWAASDAASLHRPALALHQEVASLRFMRDPTRGGFAAVMHEWAAKWRVTFEMEESRLPLREEETAFCRALGLEPLHLACEGVLMAVVGQQEAELALGILAQFETTCGAVACGEVTDVARGEVVMRTPLGARRFLDAPMGEIVPRIC